MRAISQMAEKCQKCPDRDKCSHKRMEACAYMDEPYGKNAGIEAGVNAAVPGLRETMQINVGGVMTSVYKVEIEKAIYKALHKPFSLSIGG